MELIQTTDVILKHFAKNDFRLVKAENRIHQGLGAEMNHHQPQEGDRYDRTEGKREVCFFVRENGNSVTLKYPKGKIFQVPKGNFESQFRWKKKVKGG